MQSPTQLPLSFATRRWLHFLGKDFPLCPSCRPQSRSRTGERRGRAAMLANARPCCPTAGQEVPGASSKPGPFQELQCEPRAALLFVFRLLIADQTPTVRALSCVWSLRWARGGRNSHLLGFRDLLGGTCGKGPKAWTNTVDTTD